MVRALRSVLKDSSKAYLILERYWHDKKAIVWEIRDVHRAANERELVLTNDEALQILNKFVESYNRYSDQNGNNWLTLIETIDDQCLGRKMTRPELKRFLEKDIIVIQK
jgi:hypothetical protein